MSKLPTRKIVQEALKEATTFGIDGVLVMHIFRIAQAYCDGELIQIENAEYYSVLGSEFKKYLKWKEDK